TPPFALGWNLPFRLDDLSQANRFQRPQDVILGVVGVVFWAAAAVVFGVVLSRRFRVISGRLPISPTRYAPQGNGQVPVLAIAVERAPSGQPAAPTRDNAV